MNKEELESIHRIQLEMCLEVKRICEQNDINYFIIAGTLLGSVRHQGFIPWDDDMDIGMLREDYERFIEVCKTQLHGKYFLQTWDTDTDFGLPIAKLRKNGTMFIERATANTNMHCGIYIDIFPFDAVPESKMKQNLQDISTKVLKILILSNAGYELWFGSGKIKKYIYKLIKIISFVIPLDKQKKILYKIMTKYNKNKTSKVVTFGGAYGYNRESILRDWADNLTVIKFEEEELFCPKDYEGYLSYFYGDYMKRPPLDKRYNRHGIIHVELGNNHK